MFLACKSFIYICECAASFMYMREWTTLTTWWVEADAAGAEPSRIDAAALSARIAGMTACLMRMISSMASIQVNGLLPASRTHRRL